MTVTTEKIEGRLVTIRTPMMMRRIMIWDMDLSAVLEELPVYDEVYRRQEKHGKEQSDGRRRFKANGRSGHETTSTEDPDGGPPSGRAGDAPEGSSSA